MIPVDLYDDTKNLQFKPSNYNDFLIEIQQLFGIDKPESYIYEYLTNDNEYYLLDNAHYKNFYNNDNVKQIFIYTNISEANVSLKKEKEPPYEEIEVEEVSNPNFYEDDSNNNNENIDINKNENYPNLIKQRIIEQQKEKIRQAKLSMEKQEKEEENEIVLNENKSKNNINEEKINENNEIEDKLNEILDKNFDQLKEELINESKVKLNEMVMESKIRNEDDEEEDDNIQTPSSVETHNGISCSGCGTCPIVGIRYKCVYCNHFDYCEKCEEEKGHIHPHPLYKLRFKIN